MFLTDFFADRLEERKPGHTCILLLYTFHIITFSSCINTHYDLIKLLLKKDLLHIKICEFQSKYDVVN